MKTTPALGDADWNRPAGTCLSETSEGRQWAEAASDWNVVSNQQSFIDQATDQCEDCFNAYLKAKSKHSTFAVMCYSETVMTFKAYVEVKSGLVGIAAMTSWINIKLNKFTANKHMKQLQNNNGELLLLWTNWLMFHFTSKSISSLLRNNLLFCFTVLIYIVLIYFVNIFSVNWLAMFNRDFSLL